MASISQREFENNMSESSNSPAHSRPHVVEHRRLASYPRTAWFKETDCSIDDFRKIVERDVVLSDFPLASEVVSNVLIYSAQALPLSDVDVQDALASEWAYALSEGPGVICIRGAFSSQLRDLDAVTDSFNAMIQEEEATGMAKGDHFAKAGANSRVWNALEKLAVRSPEAFAAYYANPVIALAARSWLGRDYQVTSQVNVVRPGGQAQAVHRDYHLGFMTNAVAQQYPAHVHASVSPMLTLQGAVAHCDMPIKSGPTILMPYSQKYGLGYLAWRQQEFKDYFAAHGVQVPLSKGDAIFFNPALFHAGGSNSTADVQRIANLLQISSSMGRAMETVDRERMVLALYPSLLNMAGSPGNEQGLRNAIAASAEGYPFPTNLDLDAPTDATAAPESQAEMLRRAIAEHWDFKRFQETLKAMSGRRRSCL